MSSGQPTVSVFAPALFVTVTIEAGDDDSPEVHFHVGGQGFWVARMVREFDERPILCAPVGGETGDVLRGLMASTRLDFGPVQTADGAPAYIHDRRDGERVQIAMTRSPDLTRHELDDLFGKTLRHALDTGVCVVTGRPEGNDLDTDFYRRLAADFSAADISSVGDLHGPELDSYLEGGPINILKLSDEELGEGMSDADDDEVWEAIGGLFDRGARGVVVSRGGDGAVARFDETYLRATMPELEVVDHTGAGDSMTAALAVGLVRQLSPSEALRWSCAAGAANVTRHGLGSSQAELVDRLAELVTVEERDP